MEQPTLEAILKLNAASFKENIDAARAKAGSFNSRLSELRGGVSGVSSAMSGLHSISGSTTGVIGGLTRTISGLVAAFSADPIFAVAAAIAAVASAAGAYVENQAKKMLEITKRQNDEYKVMADRMMKAYGARAQSPLQKAVDEKSGPALETLRQETEAELSRVEDLLGRGVGEVLGAGGQNPLNVRRQELLTALKEITDAQKKLSDESDKELQKERERGRKLVEQEIENDQHREAEREKMREAGRRAVEEAIAEELDAENELQKKRADIIADTNSRLRAQRKSGAGLGSPMSDMMGRIGGYIGTQADPNARHRDQLRVLEDIRQNGRELLSQLEG